MQTLQFSAAGPQQGMNECEHVPRLELGRHHLFQGVGVPEVLGEGSFVGCGGVGTHATLRTYYR